MNLVDITILILLCFGALIGFKRGFTRQLVALVGIFVILILSFLLKNPVSVFLYNNLPFFNFGGIFKDITVLNILVYEIIAFFAVFFILTILYKIIFMLTKVFEKLLNATIILEIPSKVLGAVLGVIQYLIFIFVGLYVLSLPMFNLELIKQSKVANIILDKTPILNSFCDESLDVFNEIVNLKEEYETTTNVGEFNQKVLNIMIDKGILTKENAQNLIDKGKIKNITIE